MLLRPYQQKAVESTLEHFRKSQDAACLVLPTGAGKSVIIAELCRLSRERVLVLAHVKELCAQNREKYELLRETQSVEKEKESPLRDKASGLFHRGLGQKDASQPVTFAGIQSAAQNLEAFEQRFSLVIVDECHRISGKEDSEYERLLATLRKHNPRLMVLGLTATPYRLDLGWVYQFHFRGFARTTEPRPFVRCIFEVTLKHMVEGGYLTPPRVVDAPVATYKFSELKPLEGSDESAGEHLLENLLARHPRVTESIVEQIVALTESQARRGVMIFAATVAHAREIYSLLPEKEAALILGETKEDERDELVLDFKAGRRKYLVNVAVLTTGFDAPHVDFIALLRPTESVSLFQQIAGRGLRLFPGKRDCLIMDYAGTGYDLFAPEIGEKKPNSQAQITTVPCPLCAFSNLFWGLVDAEGRVTEHYGRRCQGVQEGASGPERCSYRFRFKECPECAAENDIAARVCGNCRKVLVDPDDQLKAALGLKDALVLRVSGMQLHISGARLVVTYHDEDGAKLSEKFDFGNLRQRAVFNRTFGRRIAGGRRPLELEAPEQAVALAAHLPAPDFVVGRKRKLKGKGASYLRVEARLFDYEGRYRKADSAG